jgi:putative hydrolase of the HAD superfamily
MISKKGVVFFDIDDTLVETSRFNKDAVNNASQILEENNINISQKEQIDVYNNIYEHYKADNDILVVYLKTLYVKFSDKFKDLNQAKKLGNLAKLKYEDFRSQNYHYYMPEYSKKTIYKFLELGYEVGIISQGNPIMQRRKLDCLKIDELINPELVFLCKTKTDKKYNMVKNAIIKKYGNLKLIMIGDREDVDILLPESLGYSVKRIIGDGKYSEIKTSDEYPCFKNFKQLYKSLK